MDMIRLIVQIIIVVILIGCPPVSAAQVNAGDGYTNAQCAECHEEMADDHGASVHEGVECLECHAQAVEEDHEQVAAVDCRQCHAPHAEKVTHDAHSRIACTACHITGGVPAIAPESENVIFSGMFRPGSALPPHQAIGSATDAQCGNCHFSGNTIGASSMVLPAKSLQCMPCHVATFSVSDRTTLVSLVIFLVGMAGLGAVWFSGSIGVRAHRPGEKTEGGARFKPGVLFSGKFFHQLKVLFVEVVLIERLYRLSPARWIIHGLIVFPLLFRFAFGLTALFLSIFMPDGSVTAAMLDKNNAMRALFFDITGLMILSGSAAAIMRRGKDRAEKITSLPEPGRGMLLLIGLIVLIGFVLEGLRIAMTGWPDGAQWAFLGYGISLLVKGMLGLTDIYGYVWYAHAILTGAFLALIPFTRMSHIIIAPIVLVIDAKHQYKEVQGSKVQGSGLT